MPLLQPLRQEPLSKRRPPRDEMVEVEIEVETRAPPTPPPVPKKRRPEQNPAEAEPKKLPKSDNRARNRQLPASSSSTHKEEAAIDQHTAPPVHRQADSAPVSKIGVNKDALDTSRRGRAVSAPPAVALSKDREKTISHGLSKVLRHEAQNFELEMSTAGFVKLQDLIKLPLFRKAAVQPEEVRIVIAGNPKQRFQLRTVDGVESVRAVQGHSTELAAFYQLSDDEMLRRLTMRTAPATAVHGTMRANYHSISSKRGSSVAPGDAFTL